MGHEFDERGFYTWVFLRTWCKDDFYRVGVGVIDRYYGNACCKLVIFGQVKYAKGNGASLVSIYGGSHTLLECYKEYLGSGYAKEILNYPYFDVWLLNCCQQKTTSTVFETLDPFPMREFIVTRLRGVHHRDWMPSRQSLRKAFETGELSLSGLIDVAINNIGVWLFIVSYLKETEKTDSGDSFVLCPFLVALFFA